MTRLLRVAWLVLALGGCALLDVVRPPAIELARADDLAASGDYVAAVAAYDDYLARHAAAREAPRARASRDTLAAVLAARAEVARLREELAQLQTALAGREADLARLRQDLARREAELEQLKQIDERTMRRRR